MSSNTEYLLISLPTSIAPPNTSDDALTTLRSTVGDHGAVLPFAIPHFKIGTLDALVQQADDLAKLAGACEGVVAKVGETLRNILDGDEAKVAQQKTVNNSTASARTGEGAEADWCCRTGGLIFKGVCVE